MSPTKRKNGTYNYNDKRSTCLPTTNNPIFLNRRKTSLKHLQNIEGSKKENLLNSYYTRGIYSKT